MPTATIRYDLGEKEVATQMDRETWDRIEAAREQTGLTRREFFNTAFQWGKEHKPDLQDKNIKKWHLAKSHGRGSAVAEKAKATLVKRRLVDYAEHVEETNGF